MNALNRVLTLCLAAFCVAFTVPAPVVLSDTAAVALLRGDVLLVGDRFPSLAFQKGVLAAQRAGVAHVRVLTSAANARNMRPLANVGAKVYTLPARLSGALVIVRNTAVLYRNKAGWTVLRDAQGARSAEASLSAYWSRATPLR